MGSVVLPSFTNTDDAIDCASLFAETFSTLGIRRVFGIVGVPIMEIGFAVQQMNAKIFVESQSENRKNSKPNVDFFAFRNEQGCSYAASVCGYLDAYPSVCLTVPGPGVIHALAGIGNAWSNCWPLIVLSGGINTDHETKGGFQESPTFRTLSPYCKFLHKINDVCQVPFIMERAVREATYGRPGPVYVEIPAEMVTKVVKRKDVDWRSRPLPSPRPLAEPSAVKETLQRLMAARRPLLVAGKGAAYSRAEGELLKFITRSQIPFLLTPMGKGVLPDAHPLSTASARSRALKESDVIVLLGARLNWQLHFGASDRYASDSHIIQVDISAEELGNNSPFVKQIIQSDIRTFVQQLNDECESKGTKFPSYSHWMGSLQPEIKKNEESLRALSMNESNPMSYYRIYRNISEFISNNDKFCLVNEGANTMDTGRQMIQHNAPRLRLDAGTFATMGLGVGYAIAAATVYKEKRVFCIQGDSAFGFSGMDYDTAVRYKLPIVFIVMNNSGIYNGVPGAAERAPTPQLVPATCLQENTPYEKISEVFGGKGFIVKTTHELKPTLEKAIAVTNGPVIVNILMDLQGKRKEATHGWIPKSSKL